MSLLRLRAAEVLGALIEQKCPELIGHVCGGPATSGEIRKLPSVAITPINFKFSPDQEQEWKEIGDNRLILNVGRYDALYQVSVGSKNPHVRAKLEQDITNLLFSQEGRSGVLVVDVADCDDAIVSYELDQSSWRDEAGFGDKWFSIINLNVVLPVLIERGNVFTMEEIRICLQAETAATFEQVSDSVQECVSVDENGDITFVAAP